MCKCGCHKLSTYSLVCGACDCYLKAEQAKYGYIPRVGDKEPQDPRKDEAPKHERRLITTYDGPVKLPTDLRDMTLAARSRPRKKMW